MLSGHSEGTNCETPKSPLGNNAQSCMGRQGMCVGVVKCKAAECWGITTQPHPWYVARRGARTNDLGDYESHALPTELTGERASATYLIPLYSYVPPTIPNRAT